MQRSENWHDLYSSSLGKAKANLAATGRGKKQIVSIAVDFSLVVICFWAAYSLRLGQPFSDFRSTWLLFLILAISTVGGFAILGVYRWVIRSTNIRLFRQLVKGCIGSMLVLQTCLLMIPPDRTNPRSLILIYVMFTVA